MNIDKYINKNKIFLILKSISLMLLLLIWGYFIIIIFQIFGIKINNLPKNHKIIFQFMSDITFIIFLLSIYKKDIIKDFKNYFNKKIFNNIELSLKYWLVGVSIMYISNIIISLIIPNTISTNETLVREMINKYPIFMAFELSIYAPITEEIIFRKSIREYCNNKYLYIILTGLIFGGVHIISSLTSPIYLLFLIPYSALGIALGALYYKSNNLFSTIVVHSIHNTISLILLLTVGGI